MDEEEDSRYFDDLNTSRFGADGVSDDRLVTPGELLDVPEGFLRGHGTLPSGTSGASGTPAGLRAAVAGRVERVNKLVSVRPPKSRYVGSIGDVIVGRVTEVGNKRWSVDVNARQEAVLLLGSVNLPGGAQRRKTIEDQLQMRSLFAENDVVSCEVSSFFKDGGMAVQTRSVKYGRLQNGRLVVVPTSLVKRLKRHFVSFYFGIDAVLGHNGYIWLAPRAGGGASLAAPQDESGLPEDAIVPEGDAEQTRRTEEMELKIKTHAERAVPREEREILARVANCVLVLAEAMIQITKTTITKAYETSLTEAVAASDVLRPRTARVIARRVYELNDAAEERFE